MEKAGIPFFKKADLDASIGVFFDGFSKVIVAIAILAGTFGLDGGTIFGTMMPGVFLTVVILNGGLWLYYRKIAAYRGDPDLTAIPAGLQAALATIPSTAPSSGRPYVYLALQYHAARVPQYRQCGSGI